MRRDYDPSIPDMTGDEEQLIQALLNIVNNALRAVGDEGEVTLKTRVLRHHTIGTTRHPLTIRVDIKDTGPGIPDEISETLFYPMVSASEGGTGLGLPLAQDIVNHHGGLIEYASQPGNTVFSVLLPLETNHGRA